MTEISVEITNRSFDLTDEAEKLVGPEKPNVGALVTFTGYCRDEEGKLDAMELDHYPGMAEAEITRISEEASTRWPLDSIRVMHRYGIMRPGDPIVLVAVSSRHRKAAFEGAEFIMDFLKTNAPFWKKEIASAGGDATWVSAKESDDVATARWHEKGGS